MFDITSLQKKQLYDLRSAIDNELNKRTKQDNEQYRKSHKHYIGKCYITPEGMYIKIVDYDFSNIYAMKCLVLNLTVDEDILYFETIPVFTNSFKGPGKQLVIQTYKEITLEEFKNLVLGTVMKLVQENS